MKKTTRIALTGIALAIACLHAAAQSVYRCGSAYSEAPCAGGQVIDTSETMQTRPQGTGPSAAQRDAKAAAELEKERLALEARAAPAVITNLAPPAVPSRKSADKPRKLEQFTAVVPAKPGDDKKKPRKKKTKKTAAKP